VQTSNLKPERSFAEHSVEYRLSSEQQEQQLLLAMEYIPRTHHGLYAFLQAFLDQRGGDYDDCDTLDKLVGARACMRRWNNVQVQIFAVLKTSNRWQTPWQMIMAAPLRKSRAVLNGCWAGWLLAD
jgi:hypothetical protein